MSRSDRVTVSVDVDSMTMAESEVFVRALCSQFGFVFVMDRVNNYITREFDINTAYPKTKKAAKALVKANKKALAAWHKGHR